MNFKMLEIPPLQSGKRIKPFSCAVEGCARKEMMKVRCPDCDGVFCLQHRHQVEHSCSMEPSKKPKKHQRPETKATPAIAGAGLAAKSATWSSAKGDRAPSKNLVVREAARGGWRL